MSYIESNKEIFNKIISIYENKHFKQDLEQKRDQIVEIFKEIFEEEAINFELKNSNSVYTSNYYKFESRIKKSESLKEKFYRKNIGLDLIRELGLNLTNIVETPIKNKIKKRIKLFDDVIGIRVLTELKKDCEMVLELLRNNISKFEENGIKLFGLNDPLDEMKNGFKIIKFKGLFNEEYGFELQVKSKINSAWGDLDHKLFYKNYYISQVKDTLQISMNNIGIILEQFENFLFDLRLSNNHLEEKLKDQNIIEKIYETLNPQINEKLQINYEMKKIIDQLIFFYKELNIDSKELGELDFSHFEKITSFSGFENYKIIREYNYDFVLKEIIFINWYICFKEIPEASINYSEIIDFYLMTMSKYIFINIQGSDEDEERFRNKMKILIEYSSNPKILTDIRTFEKLVILDKIISDVFSDNNFDNIEEEKISNIAYSISIGENTSYLKSIYLEEVDYIKIFRFIYDNVCVSKHKDLLSEFVFRILETVSAFIKEQEV